MKDSFAAVLNRVMARQNAKTTSVVKVQEVSMEEQLRILARVKARNNSPVEHTNPRRLNRDINKAYGV